MAERLEFDTLPSTHRRLIDLARRGAAVGTRVVAGKQTAGRGRTDHVWFSPPGGLYVSVLVEDPGADAGPLASLAIGSALAERLQARYGMPLRVKWPNDIVEDEPPGRARKLGGVLLDRLTRTEADFALAVGVGLNVADTRAVFPSELRDRVVSLEERAGFRPSLREVEDLAIDTVEGALRSLETKEGRAGVVRRIRARLFGLGARARIDGAALGIIRDLGPDGALGVENGSGLVWVRAGDLVVEA